MMNKTTIALILICLAIIAAFVIAMRNRVRKEEKLCRCCGYCTYWFKCDSDSSLGGRCDKHSTATKPFYTKWEQTCVHYDGFAGED